MNKIINVAILGVGSRGGEAYGSFIYTLKDKFKITALCDIKKDNLSFWGDKFKVSNKDRFLKDTDFFKKKRGDLLIISVLDNDHVRYALKGIKLGYDILLEKPISKDKKELKELLETANKYKRKVIVCHVLRYAPAFTKAKELIDKGEIGKLITINAYERVAYWHQAHSFIRGRWRSSQETTPMIMAKCCHDLDLLTYYANSKAKSVSSIGDLTYFNKKNAPKYAKKYCYSCPKLNTCIYSCKRIYLTDKPSHGKYMNLNDWPQNTITTLPVTKEKLVKALKTGPYGRCVFYCDNDVVDNQIVTVTFKNNIRAILTMSAFNTGGRRYTFSGTHGEIVLDELEDTLSIDKFGDKVITYKIQDLAKSKGAHGGGDNALINDLYLVLTGKKKPESGLDISIESHLIALASEESRKNGGKLIKLN